MAMGAMRCVNARLLRKRCQERPVVSFSAGQRRDANGRAGPRHGNGTSRHRAKGV